MIPELIVNAAADWECRVRRMSFDLERSFSDKGGEWDCPMGCVVDPLSDEMRPEEYVTSEEVES